jgi:lipopolysaccharide export system permease protein
MGVAMAAPTILWRYVLREVALYTLLGLGAFALLLVAGNLLKDSELLRIVAGEPALLARLLGALLPAYLGYVIPAALFGGVMLALARLGADGEITAMRAAGVGPSVLLVPAALLGLVSAVLLGFVAFELEPRSHLALRLLRRELLALHSIVDAGRVRQLGSGRTLYVAAQGGRSCPLHGVVISDLRLTEQPYYVAARCGRILETDAEGAVALDLEGGAVHLGHPGAQRYDRIQFESSVVELNLSELDFFRKRISQYRFAELLAPRTPQSPFSERAVRTEVQRRLAYLLSGLLLALLAVPLASRSGRGGRGRAGGAIIAVLIPAAYWCAFSAAQLAAESGLLSPFFLWAPNAGVALLAALLLRSGARGEA